jgi:hypothetical protein
MTALAELPRIGAYVFTSGGHKPIRGYSKAKADLDKAVAATRKKAKAKDLPGWTIPTCGARLRPRWRRSASPASPSARCSTTPTRA